MITRRQRELRLRQRLAELYPLAEMFGPHPARVERVSPPIAVFKICTEIALTCTDTRSGSELRHVFGMIKVPAPLAAILDAHPS
jgi:hypothetical protein